MIFQVIDIEFDFDGEDLHPEEMQDIIDDTVGQIWEADDEEDLVEEITAAIGWCIKSLDYRYILQ
jgi:adenine specific DNA methylase Mod